MSWQLAWSWAGGCWVPEAASGAWAAQGGRQGLYPTSKATGIFQQRTAAKVHPKAPLCMLACRHSRLRLASPRAGATAHSPGAFLAEVAAGTTLGTRTPSKGALPTGPGPAPLSQEHRSTRVSGRGRRACGQRGHQTIPEPPRRGPLGRPTQARCRSEALPQLDPKTAWLPLGLRERGCSLSLWLGVGTLEPEGLGKAPDLAEPQLPHL